MILTINGALNGSEGSTHLCLGLAEDVLRGRGLQVDRVNLVDRVTLASVVYRLEAAKGILVGTGTHWDSWASPLQKLLEDLAGLDSAEALFGKPAGIVVTEHSAGGKGVASRLMGVLNTFGLWVPPHGAVIYGMVAHEALQRGMSGWRAEETWQLKDFKVLGHNLAEAALGTNQWQSWFGEGQPDEAFRQRWLPGV